MKDIEILTIEDGKKKHTLIHFVCATCGKERLAETTGKTAKTLLSIMRDGTKIYPYCSSCSPPEIPAEDALSMSFQIETLDESIEKLFRWVQHNTDQMSEQKERLEKRLKRYKKEMQEERASVDNIAENLRTMQYMINEIGKTIKQSIHETEKEVNKVKRWYEKNREGEKDGTW